MSKSIPNCYFINNNFHRLNEGTYFRGIETQEDNKFHIYEMNGNYCYIYHKADNYGVLSSQHNYVDKLLTVENFDSKLTTSNGLGKNELDVMFIVCLFVVFWIAVSFATSNNGNPHRY